MGSPTVLLFWLVRFKSQCSFRTCLGDIRPLQSPWLSRLPSVTSRVGPSGTPVLSLLFFLSGKIPLLNEQVFAEHLPLSWAAPKAKSAKPNELLTLSTCSGDEGQLTTSSYTGTIKGNSSLDFSRISTYQILFKLSMVFCIWIPT